MYTTEDKCCICLHDALIRANQNRVGKWELEGVYSAEGAKITKDVSAVVPEECGHGLCAECFRKFLEHAAAQNIPSDKIQCPTCRKVIHINQRRAYSPKPAEVDPLPGYLIVEALTAVSVGAIRMGYNMACGLFAEQEQGESGSLEKGFYATVLVAAGTMVPTLLWGLNREYQRRQQQAMTAAKVAKAYKSS